MSERPCGQQPVSASDPVVHNIRAVAKAERAASLKRPPFARICDRVTHDAGTTWSIALHAAWFASWIALNTVSGRRFDPFPFSLLTSIVSLEAIFLTLFVLASQNRLTQEADKRAHLDLQVNLLAAAGDVEDDRHDRAKWRDASARDDDRPSSSPRVLALSRHFHD